MAIDPDVQARLDALVAQGETKGCVNLSELSELMQEAGLDDEQAHEMHEGLEARGLELTDDCGRTDVANLRYANDEVQVLAVSVDSVYSHKIWSLQEGFEFPLLADFWPHGEVAQRYEVFNEAAGFANRGTFLIDRSGLIRFAEEAGPGSARDQQAWQEAIAALKA